MMSTNNIHTQINIFSIFHLIFHMKKIYKLIYQLEIIDKQSIFIFLVIDLESLR